MLVIKWMESAVADVYQRVGYIKSLDCRIYMRKLSTPKCDEKHTKVVMTSRSLSFSLQARFRGSSPFSWCEVGSSLGRSVLFVLARKVDSILAYCIACLPGFGGG